MKTQKISDEMKESPLHQLFLEEIQDIYWAEKHLLEALPKMAKASTSKELRTAFENHLDITQVHVERLEKVFEALDEKPQGKTCEALKGLVKEAQGIIDDTESDTMVRDCGLIMAAQKVEHYEIATYGTLRAWAAIMGHPEVQKFLQATLDEEHDADVELTKVAMSFVNEEAMAEK
ncbi:ferritin-like domain-containing protein [Runella sp.]|jgi:ferritin-like metal-binding protein YciE|uniref:YciE/YciF ferroxidase family protein n=1 Tax=Runella sp. TaxID=1960881 RepID=UPI00261C3677|nr:ferritin-like domain-containing protein [Runella sp.]